MIDQGNIDFGMIRVHKEAIADLVFSAFSEIEGVSLISNGLQGRFFEYFGKKRYSGIKIQIDKDGQITILIRMLVRYGINISTVGRQVQEAVRTAVERTADLNVKDININVCGIERGPA